MLQDVISNCIFTGLLVTSTISIMKGKNPRIADFLNGMTIIVCLIGLYHGFTH